MTQADLDGPRLAPASGGEAQSLVVLLHGFGANGDDLIPLAQEWRGLLPDAAFVSPHAPEPCEGAPMGGRQWFRLTFRDPTEYWRGVTAAAPALERFLDRELARLGLGADRLALVGFSQGTMMALHVGLRRIPPPAAILGYSGMIAGPEHLAEDVKGRAGGFPPVLLVHGDRDEVIPVEAMHITREALARAGIGVEWHESPGMGHGIDGEGLRLGGAFLARALSRRPASEC